MPPPSIRRLKAYLATLDVEALTRRREGKARAEAQFLGLSGSLTTERTLQIVQIDHTKVDVTVCLSAWPISVREAIVRANGRRLRSSRRGRAGSAVAPGLERRRSGIDETTRVKSGSDVQLFDDRRP